MHNAATEPQDDRFYETPYGLIGVAFRAVSSKAAPWRLCAFDTDYTFKGYLTSDRYTSMAEALEKLDTYADFYKYRIHFRNYDAILATHAAGLSGEALQEGTR